MLSLPKSKKNLGINTRFCARFAQEKEKIENLYDCLRQDCSRKIIKLGTYIMFCAMFVQENEKNWELTYIIVCAMFTQEN